MGLRFASTATSLQFESANKTYHLTELARGDFNGDGAGVFDAPRATGSEQTADPLPAWVQPSAGGIML